MIQSQNRKIWIDLENSPHVPFFKPIIRELNSRGYRVVLTARDAYQVPDLLREFNLNARLIGHHFGKNKVLKVLGCVARSLEMAPLVVSERPALAVSHGSRSQLLLASLLRIPSAVMFDYEHTKHVPYLKPTWIIIPEMVNDGNAAHHKRVFRYPGIKEDVYVPEFVPSAGILDELGVNKTDFLVTVRPPATEAHYHNPESEKLFAEVISFLSSRQGVRMAVLPRSERQVLQIEKQWPDLCSDCRIIIPKHVVNGLNLIWHSNLVISGGGTMNREAAALGVPVYSIFRGRIGAIDHFLAESGRLVLLETVEDVHSKIILSRSERRSGQTGNKASAALQRILNIIEAILKGDDV
ncbi:MAG: DUF354 domain-containing protein [Pseudomonadota bacterium]